MRKRPAKPFVPVERHETTRLEIITVLEEGAFSARDISARVHISEKEVYGHLEHIHKTLERARRHLVVTPAECTQCGFVFKKRGRLTRPGKCPVCKGEHIREPLFEAAGCKAE